VDEEFKEIASSLHKGVVQVPLISGATTKQLLVGLNNLTARRNGWLYVYLSNESNQNVYFDDLIVNHKRGPVVSAQDYYPFGSEGLKINISTTVRKNKGKSSMTVRV
jgi:hypothetical protein